MISFAKVRVLFSLSLLASVLVSFSVKGFSYYREGLSSGMGSTEENQHIHEMKIMDSLSYFLKNSAL